MNYYKISYYDKFKCVNSKCMHTCCELWEVDIDRASLNKYSKVKGALGIKLMNNISFDSSTPHFRLSNLGRCPFLTDNNLCELYIKLGPSGLCQICTDHPRFRNYLSDRVELGLGLSCEEVAKIVLNEKEKVSFLAEERNGETKNLNDIEKFALKLREKALLIAQDRSLTINERIINLLNLSKISPSDKLSKDITSKLTKLEVLRKSWQNKVINMNKKNIFNTSFDETLSISIEQLLVYFINRHLIRDISASNEKAVLARLRFSVISCFIIYNMVGNEKADLTSLIDIAREYSEEIEYSENNLSEFTKFLTA